MKKAEFIQEVANHSKENGAKVSQEIVKQILTSMEEIIDGVYREQDEVSILGVKFTTKEQAARTGTINMGSKQGETYETPAKIVPHVKVLKAKKDELSVLV